MLEAVLIFVCTLIYIIWAHWKILQVLQTHISLLWKVSCSIPKCDLNPCYDFFHLRVSFDIIK